MLPSEAFTGKGERGTLKVYSCLTLPQTSEIQARQGCSSHDGCQPSPLSITADESNLPEIPFEHLWINTSPRATPSRQLSVFWVSGRPMCRSSGVDQLQSVRQTFGNISSTKGSNTSITRTSRCGEGSGEVSGKF